MCRGTAYSGSRVVLEELLFTPKHSLSARRLRSQLGVESATGDGEPRLDRHGGAVPDSSWGVVQQGRAELHPFEPRPHPS